MLPYWLNHLFGLNIRVQAINLQGFLAPQDALEVMFVSHLVTGQQETLLSEEDSYESESELKQ